MIPLSSRGRPQQVRTHRTRRIPRSRLRENFELCTHVWKTKSNNLNQRPCVRTLHPNRESIYDTQPHFPTDPSHHPELYGASSWVTKGTRPYETPESAYTLLYLAPSVRRIPEYHVEVRSEDELLTQRRARQMRSRTRKRRRWSWGTPRIP